jgi:lipid A ethanolaminephosphotransferase
VIPLFFLYRIRIKPVDAKWWLQMPVLFVLTMGIGVGALATQYKFFQLIFREHRELRLHINPTYPIYSLIKYFVDQNSADRNAPLITVALDARTPHRGERKRPLLAVMVIGETARADHFSLNGYERHTNPELARIPSLLSFGNAWSCGTSTAESVPCMFSDLDREHYTPEKAATRQNLLDILQRVGVDILWIDNNSGSKGVARRVTQWGRKEFTAQEIDAYCNDEECFDDILPKRLEQALPDTRGDRLIVLHQMGEHGPSYYRRHPASYLQFQPECQQDDAFNCTNEALINAYDNDILYTDHILATLIEHMRPLEKTHDILFFFMSDHGESLGENGVYLHGAPWLFAPEAQKHVPMLLWLSEKSYQDMQIDTDCMRRRATEYADHDHIFHTLLGLFTDRKSGVYQRSLDVLAGCRAPKNA